MSYFVSDHRLLHVLGSIGKVCHTGKTDLTRIRIHISKIFYCCVFLCC